MNKNTFCVDSLLSSFLGETLIVEHLSQHLYCVAVT